MAANEAALAAETFRPRVLRGIGQVDVTLDAVRSTGRLSTRPRARVHPDRRPARRVGRTGRGTRRVCRTRCRRSVPARSRRPARQLGRLLFQVYVWRDRGLVKEMIDRGRPPGDEALVLTVDTVVFGRRDANVRRGSVPSDDRPADHHRRRGASRLDVVGSSQRTDPVRECCRSEVGDGVSPVTLSEYVMRSSIPASRGPMSSGCVRGSDRSCQGGADRRRRRARRRRRRRCDRSFESRRPATRRRAGDFRCSSHRSPTRWKVARSSSATAACAGE